MRNKFLYVLGAFAATLWLAITAPSFFAFAQTVGQQAEANIGVLWAGTTAAATATSAALPRNAWQQGNFTATVTGYASPPTGTIEYRFAGPQVCLTAQAAITGTSNATSMTMTGAPAAVRPSIAAKLVPVLLTDNGATVIGSASVATSGTITFGMGAGFSATGFTNTGTKAVPAGWTLCYALD